VNGRSLLLPCILGSLWPQPPILCSEWPSCLPASLSLFQTFKNAPLGTLRGPLREPGHSPCLPLASPSNSSCAGESPSSLSVQPRGVWCLAPYLAKASSVPSGESGETVAGLSPQSRVGVLQIALTINLQDTACSEYLASHLLELDLGQFCLGCSFGPSQMVTFI
jgi:hypothetical protein